MIYAFYALASLTFIFALVLVFHRNPMLSATSMAAAMVCLGAIYVLLNAPFLGFFQVIIYAGAVMVIILYVIMALGQEEPGKQVGLPQTVATYIAAGLFLWHINKIARVAEGDVLRGSDGEYGSIKNFGRQLVERYVVFFELASLLLVGAMVGVVVLSRKRAE